MRWMHWHPPGEPGIFKSWEEALKLEVNGDGFVQPRTPRANALFNQVRPILERYLHEFYTSPGFVDTAEFIQAYPRAQWRVHTHWHYEGDKLVKNSGDEHQSGFVRTREPECWTAAEGHFFVHCSLSGNTSAAKSNANTWRLSANEGDDSYYEIELPAHEGQKAVGGKMLKVEQ